MKKRILILSLFLLSLSFQSWAWLYPEHRDIMVRAIQMLDPAQRRILDDLWNRVRKGHEARLSEMVIDTTLIVSHTFLDYGAWPAISGDHSCSPKNMSDIVLYSNWILKVADITEQLKIKLASAKNNLERDNAMREADLKLLRADQEYASRAGGNNAHFKLALENINTSAKAYMDYCMQAGSPMNLSGIYIMFHTRALELASYYHAPDISEEEKNQLALAILANEAFGIHFLEDCFASGHVAGIWGDASQRKGTHDYYNEAGYQVTTWDGERLVLMGDAYMRPEDMERCAKSVEQSLSQILTQIEIPSTEKVKNTLPATITPDTLNVCNNPSMLAGEYNENFIQLAQLVLTSTPVPGLASGPGAMPRTTTELGPFVGFSTGARGTTLASGFSTYQKTAGYVAGLEIALRFGLGLEGLLNETSDGLTFLDLGWRLDAPSTMKLQNDSLLEKLGGFGSAIPGRDAYFIRLRLPFYLIPGDLLILAPTLFFTSQKAMNKVVSTAGNGGLIPWQRKMITSIGSFQFILGREVSISFYGLGAQPDVFILPYNDEEAVFCSLRTTQLTFPIFEYKMNRTYGSRQSADIALQFFGGIDIPGKRTNLYPADAPFAPVQKIYSLGIKAVFDYRYYLGGRK